MLQYLLNSYLENNKRHTKITINFQIVAHKPHKEIYPKAAITEEATDWLVADVEAKSTDPI